MPVVQQDRDRPVQPCCGEYKINRMIAVYVESLDQQAAAWCGELYIALTRFRKPQPHPVIAAGRCARRGLDARNIRLMVAVEIGDGKGQTTARRDDWLIRQVCRSRRSSDASERHKKQAEHKGFRRGVIRRAGDNTKASRTHETVAHEKRRPEAAIIAQSGEKPKRADQRSFATAGNQGPLDDRGTIRPACFAANLRYDSFMSDSSKSRPWPVPARPWIMRQKWHDLLFMHWPVASSDLRDKIPAALEIDIHEGSAWVGVVPFRMTGVHPRWMPPVPGTSAFAELNVRTYVTENGKPGVWFFSLDAASALAVAAARRWFHLPYFRA